MIKYIYVYLINNNLKILIIMKILHCLNYCLNKFLTHLLNIFLIFLNIKKNTSCKYLIKT